MAGAGAEAAAILGICRMYVQDVAKSNWEICELCGWIANEAQ
jgi:hypothetical protein